MSSFFKCNFELSYNLTKSVKNIILDNRYKTESIADFVFALKQKKDDFPDIYVTILEATQNPPKFVINKNAKGRDRGSLSNSEKVSLDRVYSRGRAAFGSDRTLRKADSLSKK